MTNTQTTVIIPIPHLTWNKEMESNLKTESTVTFKQLNIQFNQHSTEYVHTVRKILNNQKGVIMVITQTHGVT